MNQVVHVERTVLAPPEVIFDLVADAARYPEWTDFSEGGLERLGSPDPSGLGAIRAFKRGRTRGREEVVAFEPPNHLAYVVLSGVPVKDYRGDVTVAGDGSGGSVVTWHSEFRPKWPGTGWTSRIFLRKFLTKLVSDLAKAAETSAAHVRSTT
jgi:hypothetical protein